MRSIQAYVVTVISLWICSCSNVDQQLIFDDNPRHFSKFEKNIDLSLKEIGVFHDFTPSIILPHDSIIFLISLQTKDDWIKVYSLPTKKLLRKQLQYGRGPNEALSAFSSGILNDSLWIHDITRSRLMKYKVDDLIAMESPPLKAYKMSHFFYSSKMLNDSILVGSGMETTAHKLQLYNIYSGEIKNQSETYDIPKNLPVSAAKDVLRTYVNVRNSNNGLDIALTGRYSDVVEFFDSKSQLPGFTIQGPFGFDPIFDIGSRDGNVYMKKRPDSRKAYVNSISTEKYIYALYSGGLRNEGHKWSEGQFIHVFDWQGKPKTSYNLGQYVYGYGIDGLNNRIYIYSEENGGLFYADL